MLCAFSEKSQSSRSARRAVRKVSWSKIRILKLDRMITSACAAAAPRRSPHFDQSDAIQLITFSTECLSRRRRRRREPLRCPSSGPQGHQALARPPHEQLGGPVALLAAHSVRPSVPLAAVDPSLITAHSVPDHRSSGRSKWQQVIREEEEGKKGDADP